MNRRDFLKIGASFVSAGLAATGGLGVLNQAWNPIVRTVRIPVQGLSEALEGFRIVQISDIHLRPYTTPELVQQAVSLANELRPDILTLTGDFLWGNLDAAGELSVILSGLNARLGVFASPGNHDLWLGMDVIRRTLGRAGIEVLVNRGVRLPVGPKAVWLAGLDDGWSGDPNMQSALAKAPSAAPVVLMLHEPDLADWAAQYRRVTLQLSGHSHGGQVRLPLAGAPILPYLGEKYPFGLYRVNGMWLYTNPGLGVTGVPLRYNCPPEVTLLTLEAAERD
jgi:predicted MPP superfamily phosphohydrolase